MTQWFGLVFFGIGILIYKSTLDATLLGSAIVGALSMGVGGALGFLYELKFGRYNYNVAYFIDNVLWLFVFCVPGFILGSVVQSILNYFIYGNWTDGSDTFTTTLIIMVVTSLYLTYRKMRSKQRKRFEQS